jgi:hypothetical protein
VELVALRLEHLQLAVDTVEIHIEHTGVLVVDLLEDIHLIMVMLELVVFLEKEVMEEVDQVAMLLEAEAEKEALDQMEHRAEVEQEGLDTLGLMEHYMLQAEVAVEVAQIYLVELLEDLLQLQELMMVEVHQVHHQIGVAEVAVEAAVTLVEPLQPALVVVAQE